MAEMLVFNQTVEAFVRALGSALTIEAKARFKTLGVDFDARLLPAYPFETWLKVMELGAQVLLPKGSREAQFFNLGYRIVGSYGETLIGRALIGMMRVIGPRRSLSRMTRNLRTANNFTEVTVEDLPDGVTAVTCHPVITPDFFRGMFTGAIEVSGGTEVKVEMLSFVEQRATYSVRWK